MFDQHDMLLCIFMLISLVAEGLSVHCLAEAKFGTRQYQTNPDIAHNSCD